MIQPPIPGHGTYTILALRPPTPRGRRRTLSADKPRPTTRRPKPGPDSASRAGAGPGTGNSDVTDSAPPRPSPPQERSHAHANRRDGAARARQQCCHSNGGTRWGSSASAFLPRPHHVTAPRPASPALLLASGSSGVAGQRRRHVWERLKLQRAGRGGGAGRVGPGGSAHRSALRLGGLRALQQRHQEVRSGRAREGRWALGRRLLHDSRCSLCPNGVFARAGGRNPGTARPVSAGAHPFRKAPAVSREGPSRAGEAEAELLLPREPERGPSRPLPLPTQNAGAAPNRPLRTREIDAVVPWQGSGG